MANAFISFEVKGNFKNTEKFLQAMLRKEMYRALEKYARQGVNALASATPVSTGQTAAAWDYEIEMKRDSFSIIWINTHVVSGLPIVILLQYGHGTGTGGYVQGQDFINPAIRPEMDKIAEEVWKAVTSA